MCFLCMCDYCVFCIPALAVGEVQILISVDLVASVTSSLSIVLLAVSVGCRRISSTLSTAGLIRF